jgi:hypothetical protein
VSRADQFFQIKEDERLFNTLLPPFPDGAWTEILGQSGFVWICGPYVDLSGKLDSLVANSIFGTDDLDLQCSIHRMELDVSIPTARFLQFASRCFGHGIDLVHSEKHQPSGFRLSKIKRFRWPEMMEQNQINLILHRPNLGEPSLVTSARPEVLHAIIERLTQPGDP